MKRRMRDLTEEHGRFTTTQDSEVHDKLAAKRTVLTALEGAFLLARTLRTPEPFHL